MNTEKEIAGYALEPEDWQKLVAINRRLYDDRPISPDQRRDLANAMEAIMHKAVKLYG